jgi:hypothetical protein
MRRQDTYVRQELQKQFSEKHPVDMKFLKVPKVERFLAWSGKEFQSLAASYHTLPYLVLGRGISDVLLYLKL